VNKTILAINSLSYIRNKTINDFLKQKNNLTELSYKGNFLLKNIKLLKIFFKKFDLILINWNSWSSFFFIYFINKFRNKIIIYDAYTLIYEDYRDKAFKKNTLLEFIYKKIEIFIYSKCNIIITDTVLHKKKIQKILKDKKKIIILNVSQKNIVNNHNNEIKKKLILIHAGADRKLHGINQMIYLVHGLPFNLKKKIFFKIVCKENYNFYKKIISRLNCEKYIKLIKPLRYNSYLKLIKKSHLCLGLFGKSNKADNVISNFIVTSTNLGKTIVTKKTKAATIYLNKNKGIFLLKKPYQDNFSKFIKKYQNSPKFRNQVKNKSKLVFLKNFEINRNLKIFSDQLKYYCD
jgi:hypothetical protein